MSVNIIGQDKLKSYINNTPIDIFPHAILLCGQQGSGRHLMCQYIAETKNMVYCDVASIIGDNRLVTKSYTVDDLRKFIDSCYTTIDIRLLVIDSNDINNREYPVLLKFLEEPPANIFIVIIGENTECVIETIRNRTRVLYMNEYTDQQLSLFVTDKDVYSELFPDGMTCKFASTPGQIQRLCGLGANSIRENRKLCTTIFTQIQNANYSNILTISERFFPQTSDKFPFDVFLSLLIDELFNIMVGKLTNSIYFNVWMLTNNFIVSITSNNVNKKLKFENYLFKLKDVLQGAQV